MMWGGYGGGWTMFIGMLMMAVFWGALILLFIWGIRALTRTGTTDASAASPASPGHGAIGIVRERYARGDITKDEYEAILNDLER